MAQGRRENHFLCHGPYPTNAIPAMNIQSLNIEYKIMLLQNSGPTLIWLYNIYVCNYSGGKVFDFKP